MSEPGFRDTRTLSSTRWGSDYEDPGPSRSDIENQRLIDRNMKKEPKRWWVFDAFSGADREDED